MQIDSYTYLLVLCCIRQEVISLYILLGSAAFLQLSVKA